MIQKKICLLGAFSVGKTSLIQRYVNSLFDERYLTTVGVKIEKKELTLDGSTIKLMVWDLAGEDDFTKLNTSYLRGSAACIVVIDGTRMITAETARELIAVARERLGSSTPIIAALNKSDLIDEWEIDEAALRETIGTDIPCILTSALTGDAVESLFVQIARQTLEDRNDAA